MPRLTFQDIMDSSIPRVCNMAPDDVRLYRITNEAVQRLMSRGKWVGTTGRYLFCVSSGCITLPRSIETVEAAWVNNCPLTIRNQWFEYLESGYGLQSDSTCGNSCGGMQLIQRGQGVAFQDIMGTNKKIRVYADVAEATDAKILLQGYDENNQWIRTNVSGTWYDGEFVAISTTAVNSTNFFSALVAVQKPETNGTVRLYEYNNDNAAQRAIAIYENDETRPTYRQYIVPGLSSLRGCNESSSVTVIAKLAYLPVKKATDWLVIGNLGAIKDMCQSIIKAEMNLFDEAAIYEGRAIRELEMELKTYRGSAIVTPMRFPSRAIAGAAVENMI